MSRIAAGMMAVALLVSIAAVSSAPGDAPAPPSPGDYADRPIAGTESDLAFHVNPSNTKIDAGAELGAGFPCAKKSVFTKVKIPLADNVFSFRGKVFSASGKPRGKLRWKGAWLVPYQADGTLKLTRGKCKSGRVEYAASLPPVTPDGLTATTASNSEIDLDWSDADNADSYRVLRSTSQGGPFVSLAETAETSHDDMTASFLQTYYYEVQALNESGASGASDPANATACTDSGGNTGPGTNLGTIKGDDDDSTPPTNEIWLAGAICPGDQDWYYVQVQDTGGATNDAVGLTYTLSMSGAPPAGDLNLMVRCFDMPDTNPSKSSTNGGTATETMQVASYENVGQDDTHFQVIRVTGFTQSSVNTYMLTLHTNPDSPDTTCGADT